LLTPPPIVAAPSDVRQAYKQFIGAVVELLNGEAVSEELQQVAQAVYRLFGAESDTTDKPPLQKRYML
jgi:activating signal cointegrator complex subunit 3